MKHRPLKGNSPTVKQWNREIDECVQEPNSITVVVRYVVNREHNMHNRIFYINGQEQYSIYMQKKCKTDFKMTAKGTNWEKRILANYSSEDKQAQYIPYDKLIYFIKREKNKTRD